MNYAESIQYLYGLGAETLAMKFGLESIRVLAEAFDHPEGKYPAVHIAGTNGKGSTAAMVERIARAAGLRTGLYTSPHLIRINERIQVEGIQVADDEFARLATEVRERCERLVGEKMLAATPTFFEQVTMIAFLFFARRGVDLAVLEVGMGGRLDATNICAPMVTAITPVGFDHQKHLGNTLVEIAGEKAGIIKPGVPVMVAPQPAEAMSILAARAAELDAPLITLEDEFERGALDVQPATDPEDLVLSGLSRITYRSPEDLYEVRINLRGRHQAINAMTAIRIAEGLRGAGFSIPREAILAGLEQVEWPGRLDMMRLRAKGPLLLLDGAHNAAGARVLSDFLAEHFSARPITLLFGVMADKAIAEMAEWLFPRAEQVIVTRVNNARAADPGEIASLSGRDAIRRERVTEALAEAFRITPENGLICACGSLFLVGEIMQALTEDRQKTSL